MATEPTPTDAEIGAVMQLVLQCTDARLAWDSDATAESYAAWKASLAAVRDRLASWGAQPAPADSVLEDAALSSEQQRAIFEAYESAASESYFEVRPQIDCSDRRRVFKAGYERGWDAARKQGGA